MKATILLITTFLSSILFGQPTKGIDSATLENNTLFNYSRGIKTQRGVVQLTTANSVISYDSLWGSYFSAGSNGNKQTQWNVVIGKNAGDNISTGNQNTLLNHDAGQHLTIGRGNFAVNWDALRDATSASYNVAIEEDALRSCISCLHDIAIGKGAGFSNTNGQYNIHIGYGSGNDLATGNENTMVGSYSGWFVQNGYGNSYLGFMAGEGNAAVQGKVIHDNTFIGHYAGAFNSGVSNAILIGANTEASADGDINIGNVWKGNINTGDFSAKSVTVSGHKITADNNYLYVDGHPIPYNTISAITSQFVPQAVISLDGKIIGFTQKMR